MSRIMETCMLVATWILQLDVTTSEFYQWEGIFEPLQAGGYDLQKDRPTQGS